eukprot:s8393_g3.t1
MGHEELTTARWTRVNSRACSLILQCLVETIRLDLIARRAVQSAPLVLFRLHTCYQPGGASERSAVLSNLHNPIVPASLDEALVWLRSWPRWVQRCKDLNMVIPDGTILARTLTAATTKYMSENADTHFRRWVQRCKDLNMVIPDGTILARTLTAATTKYMSENADTHFRTQLLRSSLRIDGQPAFQDVLKYHQHLQAEAESMISSRATLLPSSTAVRLGNAFAGGSEEHRQRDCPSKLPKPPQRGSGSNSGGAAPESTGGGMPAVPKVQSAEPDGEASPVSASSVVPGELVWTLESLLQAAAKVAGAKPASSKAPTINVLVIRQGGYGDEMDNTYALVDSGATHALRQAASTEEWSQATG